MALLCPLAGQRGSAGELEQARQRRGLRSCMPDQAGFAGRQVNGLHRLRRDAPVTGTPRPDAETGARSPAPRPRPSPADTRFTMVCIWIASCATCGEQAGRVVQGKNRVVHRGQDAPRKHHQRLVQHGRKREHAWLAPEDGASGIASTRVPARHAPVRQAGRREARRMQQKAGVHFSPCKPVCSCTSPVASISSSATCGHCAAKRHAPSAAADQNPRWTQRPGASARPRPPRQRARARAAPAPAPAARAPRAAALLRSAVSCTLRLVRSNRRTPSGAFQPRNGLGQRRLGHVQAQPPRGQSAALRPRQQTGATAAVRSRDVWQFGHIL